MKEQGEFTKGKLEKGEGIDRLKVLEEMDRYVFHGSPDGDIQTLIPKQAHHVPDLSNPTEMVKDGNPAVSATPYADFAIFRAIINKKNMPNIKHSGFGFKGGEREFRLSSRDKFEDLKDISGYVYVFNKSDFEPYSRNNEKRDTYMEWRSYSEVKPIEIVKVTFRDIEHILPKIESIEDSSH